MGAAQFRNYANKGGATTIPGQRVPGPNQYGATAPDIKTIGIDLTTAPPAPQEYDVTGDFIWCFASKGNDITATAQVYFKDLSADPIPFTLGASLAWPFSKLFITWTSQPGKMLTFVYAKIDENPKQPFYTNPSVALSSVALAGNNNGVVERPGTLVTVADTAIGAGATVVIRAATPTDRARTVQNTGGNNIRVGAAPAAGAGLILPPFGSVRLLGNYALSAYGVGASTAAVEVEAD